MTFIVILLLLALIFGFAGVLVEGLFWLLIIGIILFLLSGFMGFRHRGRSRM